MKSKPAVKPESKKEAPKPTVVSTAIDASFQADASVRKALTGNLAPLRGESEAIGLRLQKAFEKFNPHDVSNDGRAQRHYVAPGTNPAAALDEVIAQRVEEIRASGAPRSVTLRDTPALRRLVKKAKQGKSLGAVKLGELVDYIDRKTRVSALVADSAHSPLTAEIEAEKLLATAEQSVEGGSRQGTMTRESSALKAREADPLVRDAVSVQMESVTSPESQLSYGKIPNGADDDTVQKGLLQTFELRPGASDVTAYHDFHTLQIAFQHVWTRIFDGQLTSLGRDLYGEYVRLKDFSGSTAPDLQMSSLADLRRLIDEVKKLSQFVDEEIPANLRPVGSEPKDVGLPTPKPEDAAKVGVAVATGGVSLFIEWAFNELIKFGNSPVRVSWADFPLKFNEGTGNIIELQPPEQNAQAKGVEIVLETDRDSFKKKITFQQWDRDTQRPIYSADVHNFGGGQNASDRLVLNFEQVQNGTLTFISEDEKVAGMLLGRYVLGNLGDRLTARTRLTFRWKGTR